MGVVAAVFDHWDSRAGDPQLHSHVVVLNRAQGVDGKWRTLDSRAVFRSTVALSELYNGVLSDYLTAALGWGWEPVARRHSTVPKYEVAGVPGDVAGGVLAAVDGDRGRQERPGRPVRAGPRPGAHRPRRSSSCGRRPPWRPAPASRSAPWPSSSTAGAPAQSRSSTAWTRGSGRPAWPAATTSRCCGPGTWTRACSPTSPPSPWPRWGRGGRRSRGRTCSPRPPASSTAPGSPPQRTGSPSSVTSPTPPPTAPSPSRPPPRRS